MKLFIGITDYEWYKLHASKAFVEEVNFWRPSPNATFKALQPGEPFLFKLHSPRNHIVGGGFFIRFLQLPVSLAWETFGEGNGARSLEEVRVRIARYRHQQIAPYEDPQIGCIILEEPFFFDEPDWIPVPPDFKLNIVSGKGYDLRTGTGLTLWEQVGARLDAIRPKLTAPGPATIAAVENARFGRPVLVTPRLGQGSFRALVTEAYRRRCAMTTEKTLPVLEAAHIRPYSKGGEHALANGILLRSDLHRLFDKGYITVEPDERRILVSRRIREEFENGREYYALHGKYIAHPSNPAYLPATENLQFHAENVFRS
jgi:putative restriction endonuclease